MSDFIFKHDMILLIILFFITFIYCWMLYQILQCIPRENQRFPSWFVWLFLLPWAGFVFQWIMLPFGIPQAFKKTCANNQDAIQSADTLCKTGLAQVMLATLSMFFHVSPINKISACLGIVAWIIYWVMIVKFRNVYLKSQ